ncbi:uncharacterized protein UBRO_05488 [Ustilago bromivora]|uniref:Uncharacterized protein n=1 Tax=Ustilago bromivora TaxID=307758 RepID=A0A1K0G757_9BASI|nr:uncharacterized protein UBRO_05488 [Ustilago bromivora]SYW82633.1 uncharacterized protein UBRO2_04755 [Ustilago bromivora]
MHFINRIGLLAALLALAQYAQAATVTVTQISCGYLYFTLGLTPAESTNAQYLGVYQGTTMISEIQFNAAYASTNSYQWYAPFFQGVTVESGPQQISFRLLDTDEEPITAYPAITQTLNFQCGTTVTTSSSAASSPTRGSGRSGNNDSGNSNSGSSSGSSSSNTGAIAGGVAGGVIALAAIGLLAFCLMRKKRQQRNQQSRIRNDEADEAAFRAPNNDSTTSLATAPETVNTPMMRDISTKNVFADPTTSTTSGALSGTSTQFTAANNNPGSGMGAGAAAAGGIGAAAIAARKQSREQTRARSPSSASGSSPSSEFSKDNFTPSSQLAPPVSALPASVAPSSSSSQPAPMTAQNTQPASYTSASSSSPSISAQASSSSAAPAAAKASSSSDNNNNKTKTKTSKWGFNRLSKDMGNSNNNSNSNKLPYPQAVPEPIAAPAPAAAPASSSSTTPSPTSASPEIPSSPSRSFKVIQKPSPAPIPQSMAGPSSASIAPSENSLNRAPQTSVFAPPRSGPATPAGSIRGTNYSRAPSVASMSAGFTDAPPLPSGAASVASAPVGEFGSQNIAGIGAGRSFAASSGNSTKWHQQSYNIMPNFSHRALARSTQLDEDLIFGHLGMGLNPPQPPTMAGNGSETGSARSAKSKTDPFGDR